MSASTAAHGMSFHEVRFPTAISRGAQGGPERRTEVVVLGSGHEERNSRWADSRRRYDAGYGVKSLDDLHAVIAFFEERRGRLHGFRWKDHADWKSCAPGAAAPLDQAIGTGDGHARRSSWSSATARRLRLGRATITKPVAGTVRIAVGGVEQPAGTHFTRRYGDRHRDLSAGPFRRRAPL